MNTNQLLCIIGCPQELHTGCLRWIYYPRKAASIKSSNTISGTETVTGMRRGDKFSNRMFTDCFGQRNVRNNPKGSLIGKPRARETVLPALQTATCSLNNPNTIDNFTYWLAVKTIGLVLASIDIHYWLAEQCASKPLPLGECCLFESHFRGHFSIWPPFFLTCAWTLSPLA